jgi:hypothetical protein
MIFLSIAVLLSACQKQTDVATLEQNKPTLEKALMELRTVIMKQSPPTIARQKKSNQVTKEWRSDLTASIGFVPDLCGSGSNQETIQVTGTGHALHLGRFTSIGIFCDGGLTQKGTLTASNGDTVFFSLVSMDGFGPGAVWVYDITGGTGRFKDAFGRYDLVFSVFDFANNVFISESTGTITY